MKIKSLLLVNTLSTSSQKYSATRPSTHGDLVGNLPCACTVNLLTQGSQHGPHPAGSRLDVPASTNSTKSRRRTTVDACVCPSHLSPKDERLRRNELRRRKVATPLMVRANVEASIEWTTHEAMDNARVCWQIERLIRVYHAYVVHPSRSIMRLQHHAKRAHEKIERRNKAQSSMHCIAFKAIKAKPEQEPKLMQCLKGQSAYQEPCMLELACPQGSRLSSVPFREWGREFLSRLSYVHRHALTRTVYPF